MRFCLFGFLIVLFCGCGISEVNSRGYIISQSQKEEVPLELEDVEAPPQT